MKKLRLLFLLLILLPCLAFTLIACDEEAPAGSCDNGHTPGDWVTEEKIAECASTVRHKYCSVCNEITDTETIPGTGHTVGDWVTVNAASCTATGLRQKSCTVCNEVYLKEVIPTLAHTPDTWVTTVKPTYESAGEKQLKCLYCKQGLDTKPIPVLSGSNLSRLIDDDLPDTLDFGGETISVMTWGDVERPEFEQENVTGDNVRDAIYDRNNRIEDRLNVELKWTSVPGPYAGMMGAYIGHVDAVYQANTQDYDIIASYSRAQGTLAVQGYLQNLGTIQNNYMDFDKPWWPYDLQSSVSFGPNAYYFVSGDMSTNMIYMMHTMFFNKDMIQELQLESPYTAVSNDTWTVDKLINLTSKVYSDLNNDGVRSQNDRYGFGALDYVMSSLYTSSNLRWIDTDEVDFLTVSTDYTSAKAVKLVNKLGDWINTDSCWVWNGILENTDTRNAHMNNFKAGNMLVLMQHFQYAGKNLLNADFDYGILPVPKYDENQVNYYTGMGNPYTLYGIFVDFKDRGDKAATLSMLTAVLECYASEGYRLTSPEIMEIAYGVAYSTAVDRNIESVMFDTMRIGIRLDLGQIFASELSNISELPSKAIAANASWSAQAHIYKQKISKQLENIVENFQEYQAMRDQT